MSVVEPPPIGALLDGRYRLVRAIGMGGVGVVYEAEDLTAGKSVAVKVLRKEMLLGGPFVERLRREVAAIKALRHPNVVLVHDIDIKPELAYFAMELLAGESLGSYLRTAPPLTEQEVASIGIPILEALAMAHDAGLVHRDVKPDNVFLAKERGETVVKLLDFGLVKSTADSQPLTATGTVLGTFQYMAPEQAHGLVVDGRADVYATAATLYYALVRKRPYQAADMEASMFALSELAAPPLRDLRPELAPAFCAVIEGALEKSLAKRPTARAFIAALEAYAKPLGGVARAPAASITEVGAPSTMPESSEPTTERRGRDESDDDTASAKRGPPSVTITTTSVAAAPETATAPTISARSPVDAEDTAPLGHPVTKPKATPRVKPEEIVAPRTLPIAAPVAPPKEAGASARARPTARAKAKRPRKMDVRVTIFVVVALAFFATGVLLGRIFIFR